ncbi:MAG: ABC transporter permease [Archaeoglobaceae archaeon]
MRDYTTFLFAALGSFLVAYILFPLLLTIWSQILDFESVITALHDELVWESLKNTLLTSTATVLISLFLGVPLGYVLARKEFRGKSLIQSVVDVPIVIPHSVVGVMLIISFPFIVDSYAGIVAAMLFVSAPFVVNSARDGFLAVDERLEHVARTLGASRLRTFFTVTLPIAAPSILSGAVMCWARAMSEVGAILIVAYYPKTAQVLVMDYFNNYGLRAAMPIATLMIGISLTIFVVLRKLVSGNAEG